MFDNFKSALNSIWNNKVRSVLTVLGVVLGVASVTILVSLGEGLKKDVSGLIQGLGTNVIAVISGKVDTKNTQAMNSSNPANFIAGDILTVSDMDKLQKIDQVEAVAPISLVAGSMKYSDKTAAPTIVGTYPNFLEAMQVLSLSKGKMFTANNADKVVVIGDVARQSLFGDIDPVGKKVMIGQDEFEVIGVLGKAKSASIFGSDFDSFALIPLDAATAINKGQTKIVRIVVKAADNADVKAAKDKVFKTLLASHNNEENFTVLTQDDILSLFDTFLNLATTMVSAIAAISLVVGGIGIMNIMLVTVTERTREIGLRKAVGATKGAILVQFLTEAVVVTLVGSAIGLLISFIVGAIIAAKTDLQPSITPQVLLIAVGISVVIGVIFGLWPAMRAAQKDPIEALRYE